MVTVRPRGKHIQYDIRFTWPDGTEYRERKNAPVASKSAAQRWAQQREQALLAAGKPAPAAPAKPATPTLAEFWPRVLTDHYRAQRKKPSTIDAAESIYRNHLTQLHTKPLHLITTAEVAALKGRMADAAPKSVNNVLGCLSRILRCAVAWGIIPGIPCEFGLLKITQDEASWYEIHDYRRLVDGARKAGPDALAAVLLGGSAGLRRGEIQALRWVDVDFTRRQISVRRGVYRQEEHSPKGNRGRVVPMTDELFAALKTLEPLTKMRGPRVFAGAMLGPDGQRRVSKQVLALLVSKAQRRAGMEEDGLMHKLRHTFCSHLAIAGVPAKAIQELAGHRDLKTTLRYLHLAPREKHEAVSALSRLYTHNNIDKTG